MKEIVIKPYVLTREIIIAVLCFIAGCGLNIFAVIRYSRPWTEIFSQIGYVVAVSIVIWIIVSIIRLIISLISKLFHKK